MTLTEFLLARIAEDEARARQAGSASWASWNRSWDDSSRRDIAANGERLFVVPTDFDEHIARHDPARVLAECAAKRRIVEEMRITAVAVDDDWTMGRADYYDRVVRALASVYADHPDFRDEWRG